jgi:hypothetical protein
VLGLVGRHVRVERDVLGGDVQLLVDDDDVHVRLRGGGVQPGSMRGRHVHHAAAGDVHDFDVASDVRHGELLVGDVQLRAERHDVRVRLYVGRLQPRSVCGDHV